MRTPFKDQVYRVTSTFDDHNKRTPPSTAPGTDFGAPRGAKFYAPGPGRVAHLKYRDAGGLSFWVNHGQGWSSYFAHADCTCVWDGKKVKEGEVIGRVGSTGHSTGPHLHWSVQDTDTGKWVNPLSPKSPFWEGDKPSPRPDVLFGMHDRGGEHLMLEAGQKGWVLVTEEIGLGGRSGANYKDLSDRGLRVLVRLNHGYGVKGTIPWSKHYTEFAKACGDFVAGSFGCDRWIIGNEMNLAWERPGGPDGEKITPELYARCFKLCRNQIKARGALHQVITGAVGPWNVQTGDWILYFKKMLRHIGRDMDGISIHTYTHGTNPYHVSSDAKMASPGYEDRYWHFRAYRDFMTKIDDALRHLPVYLTETDQYGPWLDENTGWVQKAYQEIENWNSDLSRQAIHCLVLFRWIVGNPHDPREVGWAIEDKPGVQDDLRQAMRGG